MTTPLFSPSAHWYRWRIARPEGHIPHFCGYCEGDYPTEWEHSYGDPTELRREWNANADVVGANLVLQTEPSVPSREWLIAEEEKAAAAMATWAKSQAVIAETLKWLETTGQA